MSEIYCLYFHERILTHSSEPCCKSDNTWREKRVPECLKRSRQIGSSIWFFVMSPYVCFRSDDSSSNIRGQLFSLFKYFLKNKVSLVKKHYYHDKVSQKPIQDVLTKSKNFDQKLFFLFWTPLEPCRDYNDTW